MTYTFPFPYVQTSFVALGRRFELVLVAGGRRSGQIFEIFEILGGAGDINNSISIANYCYGPYIRLLPCANKVSSAWTEV